MPVGAFARASEPLWAGSGATRADVVRIWPAWALALLGGVAAIDAVVLIATPVSISPAGFVVPLLFAGLAAAALPRLRLPPRLHMSLSGLALMLLAWPELRLFNHLLFTSALPLADTRLAAWDSALGLDWLGYALWLDRSPWLLQPMSFAYTGLTLYSCAAFALILLLIGVERAREFVLLFLVTAIAASTIGMFFPAVAAMAHHAPDPDLFRSFTPALGTWHLGPLEQLRSGGSHVLDIADLPGLTTFPSFHTAMGVVVIWCARGSWWLFPPMLALNGLMIASTPLFGSHYFVDLIAGGVLAAAAILILRRFDRTAAA
jgi:membrane-associated phospholipid phosphatase